MKRKNETRISLFSAFQNHVNWWATPQIQIKMFFCYRQLTQRKKLTRKHKSRWSYLTTINAKVVLIHLTRCCDATLVYENVTVGQCSFSITWLTLLHWLHFVCVKCLISHRMQIDMIREIFSEKQHKMLKAQVKTQVKMYTSKIYNFLWLQVKNPNRRCENCKENKRTKDNKTTAVCDICLKRTWSKHYVRACENC